MREFFFTILCCFLLFQIALPDSLFVAFDLVVSRYTDAISQRSFQWCTSIFFIRDTEWVVSLKNSLLLYRKPGQSQYRRAHLSLNQPHSIAFNPVDSLYYLVDTDNHRLLYGNSLENGSSLAEVRTLAGLSLTRPHDVVVDPEHDWVYVLNPAPVQLFRFRKVGEQEQVLDLSQLIVYARSLSLINGTIYVVGSASGKVLEIDDFAAKKIKVYVSPGKKKNKWSGNWQETGLIGNDLEFYNGFWYLTSYFIPESCSAVPCDYDKNKLIRFSSWQQFEQGKWQDLSSLLPSGLVPYFLTKHDGALFVAVYNHTFPGKGDAIYKIVSVQ